MCTLLVLDYGISVQSYNKIIFLATKITKNIENLLTFSEW